MKISNKFIKFLKEKRSASFLLIFTLSSLLLLSFLFFNSAVFATTTVNSSLANLTVWDTTDSSTMLTYPSCWFTYSDFQCPKGGDSNEYNIYFYANFTNKSSGELITFADKNCSIRFDENLTGTYTGWVNMTYDTSTQQHNYNRSFKYRGGIPFEVNCTNSTYGNVNASENTSISNTPAKIYAKNSQSKLLPVQSITEDTLFYYNFSENCTDDDFNDIPNLLFSYISGNTTLPAGTFSFDTSTGNLTINISTDTQVGDGVDKIVFNCRDADTIQPDWAEMNFTITAVNDAPSFSNLNSTMNVTEGQSFSLQLGASDEESDSPYWFNATFTSCELASWSTRGSNCTLFSMNSSGYITFNATNNDVGNYTIEFNVSDSGRTNQPYNATRTQIANFTVINANDIPIINYLCGDKRNATEDAEFACWLNANDTDETIALTFTTNATWFTFNNSLSSETKAITSNTTVQVNFTANDSSVGVWRINISINDSGGGSNSSVISFNVSNVNDSVVLSGMNNSFDAYALAEFYLEINATDDDLRIPAQGKSCGEGCYNETLTFTSNITNLTGGTAVNPNLFTLVKNVSAGIIGNASFAYIRFTPTASDAGNYTVNITVRDANNHSIDSRVFNITITANTAPYWHSPLETTFTFNETTDDPAFTLYLHANATDNDGDAITFTDNTDLFAINSSGYISISAASVNDSKVGTHTATITLTDDNGATNSSKTFTFIIKNVNETPILHQIATPQALTEDTLFTLNFVADDEDFGMTTDYSASDFYSEGLNWSMNSTTSWFIASKLNFTQNSNTTASISFTPNNTDLGSHVINISLNDSTGRMDSQEFTLTITATNHAPWFNYTGSPRNITLNSSEEYSCFECIDVNITDTEDGTDYASNTNLTIASNETWFAISQSTGKINFTINNSYANPGGWWINISVNDSGVGGVDGTNLTNSTLFRLMVYEFNVPPNVEKVTTGLDVNLAENSSQNFMVSVSDNNSNAPNSDTINVTWKRDGVINASEIVMNGTDGNFSSWKHYTNFTDETTDGENLTWGYNISAWVYDSQNNLTIVSWNVTVNHTNSPVQFSGTINNVTVSAESSVNLSCNIGSGTGMCVAGSTEVSAGGYFLDIDHDDKKYNASINLSWQAFDSDCNETINRSDATISVHMNNNTLIAVFYTTETAAECYNITAFDSANSSYNATSNLFRINLTVTAPTPTPTPSPSSGGGGGGGSSRKTPIAMKIIVPEPVTMFTIDSIVVPIGIENTGQMHLYDINLSATSTLEGIKVELSKTKFDRLLIGRKEELEMTITTGTNETGTYEVVLAASSNKPKYTDTASFFVNLIELGWKEKIRAQEKIIFLEELLMGNPECLELQEILNQAKAEFENENFKKSLELSEAAVQACKYAISSKGKTIDIKKRYRFQDLVLPLLEALFAFLIIYLIYHYLKRRRMKKKGF